MATSLLSGTTPASAQSVTGHCTIAVRGDSVFDGAEVVILASCHGDTASYYKPISYGVFSEGRADGWFTACNIEGSYHLKATIHKTGSNTNVNVGFNQ